MKRLKHWRIQLLGAVVSVLAIYYILTQVDFAILSASLQQARWGYVLPTIAFLLIGLVTRAMRWRVLLSGGLPLKRAFSMMNVAYLANNVLPLRIGELARIYLATRADPPVPTFKSASTIVVERLLDLLSMVVLVALVLTVGPLPPEIQAAGLFSAVVALVGFACLIFLARNRALAGRWVQRLVHWLPFLNRINPDKRLDDILDGLVPLTQLRTLAQVFGLTAISWGFSLAAGYILMFAFYPQGDWAATALYIAAAAFAIAVPAVPGNVGPYELSIIGALAALGYTETETALAFAVVVHAANVFVHAGTGVLGFIQEGVSLEQLTTGVQGMRQQQIGMVVQDAKRD
ncbi:MAG: flippase-like domain-containing protein [Anaerolineaceae bacterium]|nr:flippase-like domain-containing protein [Anaerolineaceae bacterium]